MTSDSAQAAHEELRLRGPDFFIVGAPKCGTTALDDYLSRHPDIFMARKECHYFAPDMSPPNSRYREVENYLAQFDARRDQTLAGESSVYYLYSRIAVRRIHDYRPDARIIVMLRNPVDAVASYHSQLVLNGEEEIVDLEQAVLAEPGRVAGFVERGNRRPQAVLYYRAVVSYAAQLATYFEVFGRNQVHVILFDDFMKDTSREYGNVLRFLEVDSGFRTSFEVINANAVARNRTLMRLLRYPPDWIRGPLNAILPHPPLARARAGLIGLLEKQVRRPPVPVNLRRALEAELRPDIERLGVLLDRDLSHWYDSENR